MSAQDVMKMMKDHEVKFVDFRFTDTKGKEQHVSVPAHQVDADKFEEGQMFDGSSIAGWKDINESDMILQPDLQACVMDPFTEESTLIVRCDIIEPEDMKGYEKDPRSIAKRAEKYMQDSGVADVAYFGNEPEFFVWAHVAIQYILKKQLGKVVVVLTAVTQVTVQALKVVTSQFHQLTQ